MKEIYVFDGTAQTPLRPVTEAANVDPLLLQAAQTDNFDWMEPMFASGDSDLLYITVFRQPKNPGGIVAAFSSNGEGMFCVIANTSLDLMAASAHFSSMVSNVRYGVDIYENAGDAGYDD